MSKNYKLTKNDGVAIVHIEAANGVNAFSGALLADLSELIDTIEGMEDVFVVIVTGHEKQFIVGADIKQMIDMKPETAYQYARATTNVYQKIERSAKIYIAAVNGLAFGGGVEFLLSFDFVLASRNAKFSMPELGLGIIPGGGGTQKLVKKVGLSNAKKMIFLRKALSAAEAAQIGLIDEVAQGSVLDEALQLAEFLKKSAMHALSYAKKAIQKNFEGDLKSGIDYEQTLFSLCFATKEQQEGMQAFLEKREPKYR